MKMKVLIKSLIILTVFLATGYAQENTRSESEVSIEEGGVQKVSILGGNYFFEPKKITVKVNVPVQLHIKKEKGFVPHNIVIKAPEAGIDIDEEMTSEVKVLKFIPTKTGQYPIVCSKKLLFFASHQEKGMEGVLEVIE